MQGNIPSLREKRSAVQSVHVASFLQFSSRSFFSLLLSGVPEYELLDF